MTVRLRQWRWQEMPIYNGFTHAERVRGWQLLSYLIDTGHMGKASMCCITGSTQRVGYHCEDYYSCEPYPLCQTVHFALHQRFKRPEAWRRIVAQHATDGAWFTQLSFEPIDLAAKLRREHGPEIADIFKRHAIIVGNG